MTSTWSRQSTVDCRAWHPSSKYIMESGAHSYPHDSLSKSLASGIRSNCNFTVVLGLAGAWLPTFCLTLGQLGGCPGHWGCWFLAEGPRPVSLAFLCSIFGDFPWSCRVGLAMVQVGSGTKYRFWRISRNINILLVQAVIGPH